MVRSVLVLLVVAASGCALDGVVNADSSGEVPGTINVQLNGLRLNGIRLNGIRMNGIRLNGVALQGASLNGIRLASVALNGSQLTSSDGATKLTGTMMIGTQLQGFASDGSSVTLRIDDAKTLGSPNQDVWAYQLSFADSKTWFPVCGTDAAGSPIEAIAVAGLWNYGEGVAGGGSHIDDPSSFTLACRGVGAIAKCVEMGYKPWATSGGVSLAAYHQACTRMVRADYCGNGYPYTVDGVPIDVYDALGIQKDTETWTFDAEWIPAGAACLSTATSTYLKNRAVIVSRDGDVGCVAASNSCGKVGDFRNGTVLMDESQTLTQHSGSGF